MIRRRLTVAACVAVMALAAAACSTTPTPTVGPIETSSMAAPASGTPAAEALTSPVDGVLTHIDAAGLSEVTGFTLRLATGREVTFKIGILENGDQFPPGHLAEHLATSTPVRVYFRPDGPDLVVYRLEDAPAS
jgi:hypothetical protein